MTQDFTAHIDRQFPFLPKSKLLIACSGGIDSMVLVHLLQLSNASIALAHCNFGLRAEESDQDALFVETYAKNNHLKLHSKRFDLTQHLETTGASTQMAARELRYRWFEELLESEPYDYLLTAHHRDDSIETFFINLTRGSGVRGLSGIPAIPLFIQLKFSKL